MQALSQGLLEAIIAVMHNVVSQPPSKVRQDQEQQHLISLVSGILAQITLGDTGLPVIRKATAQGAIKALRSLFDLISIEGGQQNMVSMLWHWSSQGDDYRQQILDCGIAELAVSLLGRQYSPVQRQTAADQLSAYVAYPTQREEDEPRPDDSRLADDLIDAGAPVALIEMLKDRYHARVRCSAAQAISTLATFSPGNKLKIIAAGAYTTVVEMLLSCEPSEIREAGAVTMITLASGDPREGPVASQTEAVVQFANVGAVLALVEMMNPVNEPSTRVMGLQALAVMANAFDDRIQKALVSAQVIPKVLHLLRVLGGRLERDSSLDQMSKETKAGVQLKAAEILACIGIDNQDNIALLVESGAIPEMIAVASDSHLSEADKDALIKMIQYLCKINDDVLAILSAMMSEG